MSIHDRRNPRRVQMRDFQCAVCGNVSTAPKVKRKTGDGHVKHMYCWRCRQTTEHTQITRRMDNDGT